MSSGSPLAGQAVPPSRPPPNAPFHPYGDTATYRDLLLFEERLKMNAEMLRRRRMRYTVFLWSFVLAMLVMAHRLLFQPPRTWIKFRAIQGCLAVVLITLVLFFASGMYEEKIRYARSYLTHSNKALRPINMHLNTRRPPLIASLLAYLPHPLRTVLVSSTPTPLRTTAPSVPSPSFNLGQKPSSPSTSKIKSKPTFASPALSTRRPSTTLLPQIPPSQNPRGELIFSSRVDRGFREGYERYRAAFERRREEKERKEKEGRPGWLSLRRGSTGSGDFGIGGEKGRATPTPPHSRRNTPPPGPGFIRDVSEGRGMKEGREGRRTPSPRSNLRFEDKGVPDSASQDADVANSTGGGATNGQNGSNGHGSNGRGSAGSIGSISSLTAVTGNRERAESYSFMWTGGRDNSPLRRAP